MGSDMKLSNGDRVCVIAPASQFRSADRYLLTEAVSLLESWHLAVDVRVDEGNCFYLAGPDPVRAGHLNDAMADPDVKAIFCTRGGYGSARILQHLDRRQTPTPKFLVGHSDVTSLHLAVNRFWPQIACIHGPNIATRQLLGVEQSCDFNRRSLHQALFSGSGFVVLVDFLRPGNASGRLGGGCLSMVTASLGTPFEVQTVDSVLFLEDTGEPPYRIDRMITHLKNADMFAGVAGVVFGAMEKCIDPYNDLKAIIRDLFGNATFPVAFGLKSGHGAVNRSIRLGIPTEMNSFGGILRQSDRTAATS